MKIGDRVKLINNLYNDTPSNPIWGKTYGQTLGTIVADANDEDSFPITVYWDNDERNVYYETCLELEIKNTIKNADDYNIQQLNIIH